MEACLILGNSQGKTLLEMAQAAAEHLEQNVARSGDGRPLRTAGANGTAAR